jgi:tetratricopeptide (TPR) repeat protein
MNGIKSLILMLFLLGAGMAGARLVRVGNANLAHAILLKQVSSFLPQNTPGWHWALQPLPVMAAADDSDYSGCDKNAYAPGWVCIFVAQNSKQDLERDLSNTLDDLSRYYWGAMLFQQADSEAATEAWKQIPGVSVYLAQQGDRAYAQGETDIAQKLWSIAEEIDSSPHIHKYSMYLTRCELSRKQGNLAEAVQWCSAAEQSSSGSWPAMLAVANQWLAIGEADRAEHIAQIILNDPTSSRSAAANARRIIGRVMISRKLYTRALQEYQWLESQGQLDKFAWYELGELYIYLDNLSAARQALGRVAELDNSTLAQRARTLLEQIK